MPDDFTQLNEKFIKARRDYETLLEASMSQPTQPHYGRPAYGYGPSAAGPPPGSGYQAPPPGAGYLPQGPPPNDPTRVYSPGPSEPQYPPQSGPAPFYMVPPQQQQIPPPQRGSPKPGPADPYAAHMQAIRMGAARPPSSAFGSGGGAGLPQELATSAFDSPIDSRQSFVANQAPPPTRQQQQQQQQPPPPQQQQGYEPYPPQSQPPSQPPYAAHQPPPQHQPRRSSSYDYPPQNLAQQQDGGPYEHPAQQRLQQQQAPPSHPPPGVPSSPASPPQSGSYPVMGPGPGYQAYQPGQRWPSGGSAAAGAAVGGRDDVDGFYR